MANRFTDSRKWHDKWFRVLDSKYKLLWLYMLDMCNHAGIFETDFELAEFMTGFKYDVGECREILKGRIVELNGGDNWFIPKFIRYQYKCEVGELNENNNCHLSIINELKKLGVYKPLISPSPGVKDKDKDKDKDIKGGMGGKRFVKPKPDEVELYAKEIDFKISGARFCDHYESKGWVVGRSPMKDWKACVRTWKKNNFDGASKKNSINSIKPEEGKYAKFN